MKNNFQLLALTCLITLSTQFSTTLSAQKNAVKINLASLGKISVDYERAYDSKNTVQVGFQRWHQQKSHSSTIPIFGILSTTGDASNIKGFRMEFIARHYRKKAFHGGFFESGFYLGKHDITITSTSSSFSAISILLLDFEHIYTSSTETKNYKNVLVAGGKIGGGYQKAFGNFDLEFSGGINVNAINSNRVRPTLAFKAVSPYARVAVGVAF